MPITELGACEWFVWDLRRSNLMDRSQLDQVVGEFLKQQPRADPPALAEFLIGQQILTTFQAERLLQGKTQGLVLGPYTLTDALGAGSMGTVYKAQSKNDHQWYAVKVLPRRSMWNVRLARRQVRAFDQCRHPAVVPFVDVGTAGSMHYLAWPLVEGRTLEAVVAEDGKLSPGLAAHYALQTAEGLDICHQQSLVHGLLKPSNLMLGADGQVRILDFGIGSLLAETGGESLVDTMSTANSLTSGLDCASPESIMEPTNRTPAGDQYSLGCVLYYCLTGGYPFPEGSAVEKMMAHQMKQPVPITATSPEVPPGLVAVVERLMQKAPEARFGTMAEVIEGLRPQASGFTTAVPKPAKPRPAAARHAVPAAPPPAARPPTAAAVAPARPADRLAPRATEAARAPTPTEPRPNRPPGALAPSRPLPGRAQAVRPVRAVDDDEDDDGRGRFGPWMTLCGLVALGALAAWAWIVWHR
jgi:serine/threonine-protein kinase